MSTHHNKFLDEMESYIVEENKDKNFELKCNYKTLVRLLHLLKNDEYIRNKYREQYRKNKPTLQTRKSRVNEDNFYIKTKMLDNQSKFDEDEGASA